MKKEEGDIGNGGRRNERNTKEEKGKGRGILCSWDFSLGKPCTTERAALVAMGRKRARCVQCGLNTDDRACCFAMRFHALRFQQIETEPDTTVSNGR